MSKGDKNVFDNLLEKFNNFLDDKPAESKSVKNNEEKVGDIEELREDIKEVDEENMNIIGESFNENKEAVDTLTKEINELDKKKNELVKERDIAIDRLRNLKNEVQLSVDSVLSGLYKDIDETVAKKAPIIKQNINDLLKSPSSPSSPNSPERNPVIAQVAGGSSDINYFKYMKYKAKYDALKH